jgi:hypothetical protein
MFPAARCNLNVQELIGGIMKEKQPIRETKLARKTNNLGPNSTQKIVKLNKARSN